ncbi:MAG: hypothetical protein B6I18_03985 [Bacteroidetes bacterium 4572_112]|nr:MAG: hypothetical protein B6I18_03985 [Bacteroidetes bacterium 4572_112]
MNLVLYLRSEKLSINYDKQLLIRSSLDLGIRGKYSFAQYAQYYYHKIGNILLPQGWQYQKSDYSVINYNVAIKKQIYSPNEYMALNALSEARLGTMFTDFSLGASAKVGLFKSVFSNDIAYDFQISAEASAFVKFVAHNGTIQGDLKNNPNVYEIKSPYIEHIVGSYSALAKARYKKN